MNGINYKDDSTPPLTVIPKPKPRIQSESPNLSLEYNRPGTHCV